MEQKYRIFRLNAALLLLVLIILIYLIPVVWSEDAWTPTHKVVRFFNGEITKEWIVGQKVFATKPHCANCQHVVGSPCYYRHHEFFLTKRNDSSCQIYRPGIEHDHTVIIPPDLNCTMQSLLNPLCVPVVKFQAEKVYLRLVQGQLFAVCYGLQIRTSGNETKVCDNYPFHVPFGTPILIGRYFINPNVFESIGAPKRHSEPKSSNYSADSTNFSANLLVIFVWLALIQIQTGVGFYYIWKHISQDKLCYQNILLQNIE